MPSLETGNTEYLINSGPCLFCGHLVVTNGEQAILDKKNKKSEKLYEKLVGDSRSQYQAAIDNKNRLLDYQANSAKRTQIIDDESDYFNVDNNKWLTPEQRYGRQFFNSSSDKSCTLRHLSPIAST